LAQALLRWVLRGLWFVLIPLLWTALALRYLVPHASSAPGLEGVLSDLWRRHTLLLALTLFLALGALVRYWQNWLPGGRYLANLPEQVAARVPRRRVAECEAAYGLLLMLETRAVKRRLLSASSELRAAVDTADADLRTQLAAGKWSKIPAAQAKLERLVRPLRTARAAQDSLLFVALLVGAALLALQLRARLAQVYEVTGNSMLPTLTPEQVLAGRPQIYGAARLPQRGDVVVLRALVDGREQELIKRVIGLPGDHIGMWGVHPIINGWSMPLCDVGAYYRPDSAALNAAGLGGHLTMEFLEGEAYLTLQTVDAPPFADYLVKPGEVFVLGDNRTGSRDSRAFDGAPRGFPLSSIRAKIARELFSRTRRGELDMATVLRPPRSAIHLNGADMSVVQARVNACLAARPKSTTPPGAPSAALTLLHD
jgi:signal peptidase I